MASTIFSGISGEVYYSSLNIVVMTLMFLLSVRLLISRQKRAYLTLTICMGTMLIGQLVLFTMGITGTAVGQGTEIVHNMLNTLSFIMANVGIYQLFGETTKRVKSTVYGLLGSAILLSFMPLAINIYALILVAIAYFTVTPFMDEGRIYLTGLICYAIGVVSNMLEGYVGPTTALHILDNLFRIPFFAVLFLILFGKVISLMESSYNKSTQDSLTGMYNRFYFYTTVSFLINERKPISVLFLDIDSFKILNDTRGHQEGDIVLKAVASILKEEAEEVGIAGRYGGEEMVVLVEDPKVNMSEFAEKVRARIEEETIVTASIGYSTYKEGITTDELIKNADKAMYRAKKTGKNRWVSFQELVDQQEATI